MKAAYQVRVYEEKAQLDDRIAKLNVFMHTTSCLDLPFEDRSLLSAQAVAMQELSEILAKRIGRFG